MLREDPSIWLKGVTVVLRCDAGSSLTSTSRMQVVLTELMTVAGSDLLLLIVDSRET
jgi:hypothetical protein